MSLPNSYAARGRQLPPRRPTLSLGRGQGEGELPIHTVKPIGNRQSAIGNIKWLVPQAQERWLAAGVAYYTPQHCEYIFRQALGGDLRSQWEMFDLMEATWPELSSCLNQLKDAVVAAKIKVEPFRIQGEQPSDQAVERAALVQDALFGMSPRPGADENDLEDTIRDLLDARSKGISVLELDWEHRPGSNIIAPVCSRWVHPAWYGYPSGDTSTQLMLRSATRGRAGLTPDPDLSQWHDFEEHKFIIGLCKNKTGHPLGSALLHVLAPLWAMLNFSTEWFFNFAQVYGQPFRWATYDPNMSAADQTKLGQILANMGASAYGMFPAGTSVELKETSKGASENPNQQLIDLANRTCRLVILRQTLTADVPEAGGSRALGEVHERVEASVEYALSKWVCKTLTPLAKSILTLNYGDDTECPLLLPGMDPEEEGATALKREVLKAFLVDGTVNDVLANLTDLKALVRDCGLPVNEEYIEPYLPVLAQPGAKVTGEVIKDSEGDIVGGAVEESVLSGLFDPSLPPARRGQGDGELAPTPGAKESEADVEESRDAQGRLIAASAGGRRAPAIGNWQSAIGNAPSSLAAAYRGSMAPFRQIILESTSREDCLRKLARAYADWRPERLAAELETALQLAAAAGAVKGSE